MLEISNYEKAVLITTAVFLLVCAGELALDDQHGCQVSVSGKSVLYAEEPLDDEVPDSLIPGEQINLNTALPLDLQRLPGIGASRAADIAAYREENGPFSSVDELLLVDGIGEVTLEKLRQYVII